MKTDAALDLITALQGADPSPARGRYLLASVIAPLIPRDGDPVPVVLPAALALKARNDQSTARRAFLDALRRHDRRKVVRK